MSMSRPHTETHTADIVYIPARAGDNSDAVALAVSPAECRPPTRSLTRAEPDADVAAAAGWKLTINSLSLDGAQ